MARQYTMKEGLIGFAIVVVVLGLVIFGLLEPKETTTQDAASVAPVTQRQTAGCWSVSKIRQAYIGQNATGIATVSVSPLGACWFSVSWTLTDGSTDREAGRFIDGRAATFENGDTMAEPK